MCLVAGLSLTGVMVTDAVASSGGEIRFQGAIVDGECSFSVNEGGMQGKCYQQGKFTRATSPLNLLSAQETLLPGLPVTTSLRWVSERHDVAVVTLTFR